MAWAGLRPSAELKSEKAAPGTHTPTPNDGAWGNTPMSCHTNLASEGTVDEAPTTTSANAVFGQQLSLTDPMRIGSFAAPERSRTPAGAGFHGALSSSGNQWQLTVPVTYSMVRSFTGAHGDGSLTPNGNADAPGWPSVTTAVGIGPRGATSFAEAAAIRIPNRRAPADAA